jgi:predicted enzyme related to lactoylglutathione lyase
MLVRRGTSRACRCSRHFLCRTLRLQSAKKAGRRASDPHEKARMDSPLGTVIIYARDMQKAAAFYARHFGFVTDGEVVEGLIELKHPGGGAGMLIHQAAKSVKLGQVGVKLSFHVKDVAAFAAQAKLDGLVFGTVHEANGYAFANAKDLDKNSISISSRAHRATAVKGG